MPSASEWTSATQPSATAVEAGRTLDGLGHRAHRCCVVSAATFAALMFVAATVAVAFVVRAVPPTVSGPEAYCGLRAAVVIGDWGRQGTNGQTETATGMGRLCTQCSCARIITSGDNFYENGITGINDPLVNASWRDVYTAASLRQEWRAALGNHDYHISAANQLALNAVPAVDGLSWYMPSRYYNWTEVVGGVTTHFVVIDSTPIAEPGAGYGADFSAQNATAQLLWLRRTLADMRARTPAALIIVVGHHPIYSASTTHGDNAYLIARLDPILQLYSVDAYIGGHDHSLQFVSVSRSRVLYIVSGAGSAVRADESASYAYPHTFFARNGVLLIALDSSGARVQLVANDQLVLASRTLSANR